MTVPDGVAVPLSVAEIFRREGIRVPHAAGGPLVSRGHQRALVAFRSEPAGARTALAVTGSLLLAGAVFGTSALDEPVVGPADAAPADDLAASPVAPAVAAPRGGPAVHAVDLAVMGSPAGRPVSLATPAVWLQPSLVTGTGHGIAATAFWPTDVGDVDADEPRATSQVVWPSARSGAAGETSGNVEQALAAGGQGSSGCGPWTSGNTGSWTSDSAGPGRGADGPGSRDLGPGTPGTAEPDLDIIEPDSDTAGSAPGAVGDPPARAISTSVLPASVLPATVLPATVLPATVLPATVLPAKVLPPPVVRPPVDAPTIVAMPVVTAPVVAPPVVAPPVVAPPVFGATATIPVVPPHVGGVGGLTSPLPPAITAAAHAGPGATDIPVPGTTIATAASIVRASLFPVPTAVIAVDPPETATPITRVPATSPTVGDQDDPAESAGSTTGTAG